MRILGNFYSKTLLKLNFIRNLAKTFKESWNSANGSYKWTMWPFQRVLTKSLLLLVCNRTPPQGHKDTLIVKVLDQILHMLFFVQTSFPHYGYSLTVISKCCYLTADDRRTKRIYVLFTIHVQYNVYFFDFSSIFRAAKFGSFKNRPVGSLSFS